MQLLGSVIGVSRPLSSTVKRSFTRTTAAGTCLRLFQTISENSFIWRPKRLVTLLEFTGAIEISLSIYLSICLSSAFSVSAFSAQCLQC